MLVLLVEDDIDLSAAIAGLLEVEGYEPTVCATVADAREAMKHRNYQVALLDWMLLEETSEALLPELAEKHIPTVFYSANDAARDVAAAWGLPFVTKPFDVELLLVMVGCARESKKAPELKVS